MTKSKNLSSSHYFTNNNKIHVDSKNFVPLIKSTTTTENSGDEYFFNKTSPNVWIYSTLSNRFSAKENKIKENFVKKSDSCVTDTNFKRKRSFFNSSHRLDKPISVEKYKSTDVNNNHTKSTNEKPFEYLRRFDSTQSPEIFYLQKSDVCINFKI